MRKIFKLKKVFITGINGQDGSYLAEHLLTLNCEVAGLVRRSSVAENQTYRINHLNHQIKTYYGDLIDKSSISKALEDFRPDCIFNLAAQISINVRIYELSYFPNFGVTFWRKKTYDAFGAALGRSRGRSGEQNKEQRVRNLKYCRACS